MPWAQLDIVVQFAAHDLDAIWACSAQDAMAL
jgi:hypothetical protein